MEIDKYKIQDDLIAYAKSKGYDGYAYGFGVISTYLTDKNWADVKRFIEEGKI
jgi:hypothetical protein